jgi:hypothetical protein
LIFFCEQITFRSENHFPFQSIRTMTTATDFQTNIAIKRQSIQLKWLQHFELKMEYHLLRTFGRFSLLILLLWAAVALFRRHLLGNKLTRLREQQTSATKRSGRFVACNTYRNSIANCITSRDFIVCVSIWPDRHSLSLSLSVNLIGLSSLSSSASFLDLIRTISC